MVVIANCRARYVRTERAKINDAVWTEFNRVPPGLYYIVVLPEGENTPHVRFREIKDTRDHEAVTINLTVADPVGRITATVLVGGQGTIGYQGAGGYMVKIWCAENGYKDYCMTDVNGVATFHVVPNGHIYEVTVYDRSDSQVSAGTCDLTAGGDAETTFYLPS